MASSRNKDSTEPMEKLDQLDPEATQSKWVLMEGPARFTLS